MPYIQIRTNKEITKEKEMLIKQKLGEAITIVGKSESWLMVEFVSSAKLYFKGNDNESIAFVDIKLHGSSDRDNYIELSNIICNLLKDNLDISPTNIYISYGEYSNWGWNNTNF